MIERNCLKCNKSFFKQKGEINKGKGKYCSLSCAASVASINRKSQSGENNPNWKGGVSTPYRESKRLYTKRHPHKTDAHMIVRNALKNGILKRGNCIKCGLEKTHGHHEDYNKPLDVIWLCKKHHEIRHVELRKMGIGLYSKRK